MRGGKRRGAGRPRNDDDKHWTFPRLSEGGQEAYKRLEADLDWRRLGPWGMISQALEVAEQLRSFDDPSDHVEPWRARKHRPRNAREMLWRYQRMVGADQKGMALMLGIGAASYGNYLNGARASVPRPVALRARDLAREFGLGRDPDLDDDGHELGWTSAGLREGLQAPKSRFVLTMYEWAAVLPLVEIALRAKYPAGLKVTDFRGPVWIAWKLLPAADRDRLVKPQGIGLVMVGETKPVEEQENV